MIGALGIRALSGLTIQHGHHPVGLVFLSSRSDTLAPTHHHDDRVMMVSPPLWGDFDDSDRCSLANPTGVVEKRTSRYIMDLLDLETIDLEAIQDKMRRRGCLSYYDMSGQPQRLGYALVRGDAWGEMVGLGREVERDHGTVKEMDWDQGFRRMLQQVPNPDDDCFKILRNTHRGSRTTAVLSNLNLPVPIENLGAILEAVVQTFYVQTAISVLRMEWSPGVGAGREDDNHGLRRSYFERMISLGDGGTTDTP